MPRNAPSQMPMKGSQPSPSHAPAQCEQKDQPSLSCAEMCDQLIKHLPAEHHETMRHIRASIQRVTDIGKCYNKRYSMIYAFSQTAENLAGLVPTISDFERKTLETVFALEGMFAHPAIGHPVIGDPIGSELSFNFGGHLSTSRMYRYLCKLHTTTQLPPSLRLVFGAYRMDYVSIIPERSAYGANVYRMVMTDLEYPCESLRCNLLNASLPSHP